jgi:pimeloyl-ACP methyl ester carboxylesterase
MQNLAMIPALGCDGGLYADIWPRLSAVVEPVTIVADEDTLTGCVQQVLEQAPEKFIILGTSFGGRTALEVAFAAPDRVQGLVIIGAGAGDAADPSAGLRRAAASLKMLSRIWLTGFPTCPGPTGRRRATSLFPWRRGLVGP